MKRSLGLSVILVLLLLTVFPACASNYTLPEKMEKQIMVGSGMKGYFSFESNANADQYPLLSALNGQQFQFRGLCQPGGDALYSIYREAEDGMQNGLNQVYVHNGKTYITGDFLNQIVYCYDQLGKTIDTVRSIENGNIRFESVVANLFCLSSEEKDSQWSVALEPYYKKIESWMSSFAILPQTTVLENGSSLIKISYVIDQQSLKDGIMMLVEAVLNDENMIDLLGSVMSEEHKALYLNRNLIYYYREALQNVDLGDGITLSRTVSTQGEIVESEIELPLVSPAFGFDHLKIYLDNGKTRWDLTGDTGLISYLPADPATSENGNELIKGSYIILPANKEDRFLFLPSGAFDFSIRQSTSESFEDEKNHLFNEIHVVLTPNVELLDAGIQNEYDHLQTIDSVIKLHYSSKTAQTSPTTLQVDIKMTEGDQETTVSGQIKTTSSWELIPINTDQAIELIQLKPEDYHQIFNDIITNITNR